MLTFPQKNKYHEYYETYLKKVVDVQDILSYLENQRIELIDLTRNLSIESQNYRYAPEKWTIKELLRHIIDTDNTFAYRAITISKNTGLELPNMDQDVYIKETNDDLNSIEDLIVEFDLQRKYHIKMINNLHKDKFALIGIINGSKASVRSIVYIIAGHTTHHLEIYRERYLSNI